MIVRLAFLATVAGAVWSLDTAIPQTRGCLVSDEASLQDAAIPLFVRLDEPNRRQNLPSNILWM